MQQFNDRPAHGERREEESRREFASLERHGNYRDRRVSGEPAKYNTRTEQRRISWENDLYERQSI